MAEGISCGRGVCIYINNELCMNADRVIAHYFLDIESLKVKCRPFFILREISVLTFTAVYTASDTEATLDTLYHHISDLQNTEPERVFIIGDFKAGQREDVSLPLLQS